MTNTYINKFIYIEKESKCRSKLIYTVRGNMMLGTNTGWRTYVHILPHMEKNARHLEKKKDDYRSGKTNIVHHNYMA